MCLHTNCFIYITHGFTNFFDAHRGGRNIFVVHCVTLSVHRAMSVSAIMITNITSSGSSMLSGMKNFLGQWTQCFISLECCFFLLLWRLLPSTIQSASKTFYIPLLVSAIMIRNANRLLIKSVNLETIIMRTVCSVLHLTGQKMFLSLQKTLVCRRTEESI